MSETPQSDSDAAQARNIPEMRIITQYVKDLSFENPNAPQAIAPGAAQPAVEVAIDVNARALADDQYEIELSCSATASIEQKTAFVVEVAYAGLLLIRHVPKEHMEGVLLVEAPRLLFPFIRQIVANTVRDGGFLPLMLDPIDFAALYDRQQKAKTRKSDSEPETQTSNP